VTKKTLAVLSIAILSLVFCFSLSAEGSDPLDINMVNAFDRLTMKSYCRGLDTAGDILSLTAMATPAVLLNLDSEQRHIVGIMYAETLALSLGASTLLKNTVGRNRPYLYFEGYPQDEVDSGDSAKSFPSRHSIFAFASATFTSYVFCKYYPDSEWKGPVIALSYTLAAATATLRVMSGNHFATDVIAGALIGSAIGYAVPALHALLSDNEMGTKTVPFALAFSIVL